MKNTTATGTTAKRAPRESGQTTAEYALVLLAAGTIAMLVISWARGENSIDELFDVVITRITTMIE